MADIPGLDADVFFGSVDAPPINWREKLSDGDSPDDPPLSEADRESLINVLGFDPSELDDDPSSKESTPCQ